MKNRSAIERRSASRLPTTPLASALLATLLAAGCGGSDGTAPTSAKLNELTGPVRERTLQFTQGTNMSVTPSPDGTKIAFALQGSLYVMPVAGGTAKRISTWDMEVTKPAWAPNGSVIAFPNYDADGQWHIWTIEPDGRNPKKLTSGPFDDREPSWSADGSRIVFSSDRGGDSQVKIWSVQVADGSLTQLTKGAGAESNPALSPDGGKLLYTQAGGNNLGTVQQIDLKTGAVSAIGPGFAGAWTPEGDSVVVTTPTSITRGAATLASGEDVHPFPVNFLKDGQMLYTANGGIQIRSLAGGASTTIPFTALLDVRLPDFTGRKKDHKFLDVAAKPVRGIANPALSPDGSKVAFAALNDIWVVEVNGGAPVQLTNSRDNKDPAGLGWLPDGSAVYYSTDRDNNGFKAVDTVNVATKAVTRLARLPSESINAPTLSPSGRKIAFLAGGFPSRIDILEVASGQRTQGTVFSNFLFTRPSWTANEARVVTADVNRINNRFREGYTQLRVLDPAAKTGTFYPVGPAPAVIADRVEGYPVVSPDGSKVAFVMDGLLTIMPLNPDGSPAGPATALNAESTDLPSWSGDSRVLAYMASGKLKTIDIASRTVREVSLSLQYRQAVPAGLTMIRADVWNGVSSSVQRDMNVVIEGNRIVAIEPHGTRSPSSVAKFVDAAGKTLIPGMWDVHTHGVSNLNYLANGFTSVASMGNPVYQQLYSRESLEAGKILGPRLFVTPPTLDTHRSYQHLHRSVKDVAAAELEMAKYRAMDVDALKSYVRAPIPIMAVLGRTAQELGIPSFSHYLSPGVQMGYSGTAHLFANNRMSEIRLNGTLWYDWSSNAKYQDVRELRVTADHHTQSTGGPPGSPDPGAMDVHKAGGLVALGTDSDSTTQLHRQLGMAAASAGNLEAMKMVTSNTAKMMFADRYLGSVEVGKVADLVVLNGNPLDSVENAQKVVYVVKNGFVATPTELFAPAATTAALGKRVLLAKEVRLAEAARKHLAHMDRQRKHDHAH